MALNIVQNENGTGSVVLNTSTTAPIVLLTTDVSGNVTLGTATTTVTIPVLTDTSVSAPTVSAGSSGVAGIFQVFPTTASKGKTTITMADNTGNTTTNINVALQAAARTLTIPDPGASASFVMTGGAQTVGGAKSFTSTVSLGASGTAGQLDVFPTTTAKGKTSVTMSDNTGDTTTTINVAAQATTRTLTIPDPGASASFVMTQGAQTIAGATTFSSAILAGASGTVGELDIFPTTASKGKTIFTASDNTGNTTTTINTALQATTRTYTIPDAGANASFVFNTDVTDNFRVIPGVNFSGYTGTFTKTRSAAGNYYLAVNAAAQTSLFVVDISQFMRSTASKGLKINSIDFIYTIGTANATSVTASLYSTPYTNNGAVTPAAIALAGSGALTATQQANPFVVNLTVTTPAYVVTTDTVYWLEIAVVNPGTTVFNLYGACLNFATNLSNP